MEFVKRNTTFANCDRLHIFDCPASGDGEVVTINRRQSKSLVTVRAEQGSSRTRDSEDKRKQWYDGIILT